MMLSRSPRPVTSPVVHNGRSLLNRQNQHLHGPSGNPQLTLAKRRVSVPAGGRDSSQGGSFIASTIQAQKHPPRHLRWTILALQISPRPLHSNGQWFLQPSRRVQLVLTHQHPVEPHRETQRVALYPALPPALPALPLLSVVLKTCLPSSQIQKPAPSLQIHCKCELQTGLRDRGSGNCKRRRCLYLDQWSLAVPASIDLATLTWRVMYLHRADSWSSTCGTDGRLWVQMTWRR